MTRILVTDHRLANLLRIDRETLRVWSHSGFLVAAKIIDRTRHYDIETIDHLLQQGARNFYYPPTVQALLSGELKLLTTEETCQLLNVTLDTLYRRISAGSIAAIKLRGAVRVHAASVQNYIDAINRRDILSRGLVGHVLGIGEKTVGQIIQQGALQCVEALNDTHMRPVTDHSLLALLQRLLPFWIRPEDWLEERLADSRPLMVLDQLILYLGLHADGREIHHLIASQRLQFIQTPGGERRFSPVSADEILEFEGPIEAEGIANLFGASAGSVKRWKAKGFLRCLIHSHQDDTLYRPCLLFILGQHLSPDIKPRTWYNWRMQYNSPLLGTVECMSRLGMTKWQVYALVRDGVLRGIRHPDSKKAMHVSLQHVQDVKRQLNRKR